MANTKRQHIESVHAHFVAVNWLSCFTFASVLGIFYDGPVLGLVVLGGLTGALLTAVLMLIKCIVMIWLNDE